MRVEQYPLRAVRCANDVPGLEVAVDHAEVVDGLHSRTQLQHHLG